MSSRTVTTNLSTFTFEQLEEAYSQLAVMPRSTAFLNDVCQDLHDELEARVQLRKAEETQ